MKSINRKEYMVKTMEKKSTFFEKIIYGFGDVGANLCWTFMAMYIMTYYTDSVGVSAAIAGTIMLVARFLDGVSDVIFAMLMEKVHFKSGKVRPWFLIAAPLLGISLYLSFNIPASLSDSAKVIYVACTYTFTAAVSYTIYNLAYSSVLSVMTKDTEDRQKAATIGRFITTGGVTVMYYVTPVILMAFGGYNSQNAWSKLSLLYAVLCTVFVASMGLFIKEKSMPEEEGTQAAEVPVAEKRNLGEMLKIVLGSKYSWILLGMFFLFYLFSGLSSARVYFFKDVMGDFSLFSTASMLASLPQLFALLLVPFLFSKLGKRKAVISGMVVFVVCNVLFFLFHNNLTLIYALIVIMSLGMAPLTAIIYAYIADLADYLYTKAHEHVESLVAMSSSVGTKIGTGLGSAVVGWGLALIGYDGAAAVQTEQTLNGIVVMTTILPLILGVLIIVLLIMWDLDKKN